jgi:hypothetical protein
MTKTQQAFEIGYNAAKNKGYCIFSQNAEAQALTIGMEVGNEEGMEIMKSFCAGVDVGIDENMAKLMAEE